jgi:3-phosphoshikimate 1-carboxyvinyltransferase
VILLGLDENDTQGDKAIVDMLRRMGVTIEQRAEGREQRALVIAGGALHGATLDLSDTPDALPALAVTACFAEGETRLVNVPQARLKETDRIAVMREELTKMGADIEELPDGLVIRRSKLKPAVVHGHYDHRVIMALAVAGLCLDGETEVYTAEALSVTFPNFVELMNGVGGNIRKAD